MEMLTVTQTELDQIVKQASIDSNCLQVNDELTEVSVHLVDKRVAISFALAMRDVVGQEKAAVILGARRVKFDSIKAMTLTFLDLDIR